MGFYIRKSVSAGPFRFNLSKSGVGISTGIPGFRLSSGPRGNYVHMGRHGLYYRATLADGHGGKAKTSAALSHLHPSLPVVGDASIRMDDPKGASVQALKPTGDGDLVDQLNDSASKVGLALPVAVLAFVASLFFMPWGLILWAVAIPGVWWLALRDRARRTVVVFYDINNSHADWYQRNVDAWSQLRSAQGLWRVVQSRQTAGAYQAKVNAGAGTLLSRVPIQISVGNPKYFATNVLVPTLVSGKVKLHFLPDRILVSERKRFTDVSYDSLRATSSLIRFIESGTVPRDALVVGQTWQYVNKNGGPDRRFNNNRQLPVVQYAELSLTSAAGFRWDLQASLAKALQNCAAVIEDRPETPLVAETDVEHFGSSIEPIALASDSALQSERGSAVGASSDPKSESSEDISGQRRSGWKPTASTWAVGVAALLLGFFFWIGAGFGAFLIVLSLFALPTAIVALAAHRPTWMKLPTSGLSPKIALSAAIASLILGGVISGITPHSARPVKAERASSRISLADFTGDSAPAASKGITSAGLTVKLVTEDGSPVPDSWAGWTVVTESPSPGATLSPDTTVTITLRPPARSSATATPTVTPAPTAVPSSSAAPAPAPVQPIAPAPVQPVVPAPVVPVAPAPAPGPLVTPGAFCPNESLGVVGHSAAGKTYTCGGHGADANGHLHWNTD
ncbi:MAG: polymerase subunit epsilon [Actinomycetota bacterium]|nr:polymerase subunit epsilon [Actinomycetota bacterium]